MAVKAITSIIGLFIGQNFIAEKPGQVREGIKKGQYSYCYAWGLLFFSVVHFSETVKLNTLIDVSA